MNELYLAKRIDYFDGGVDVCIVLTLDGQVIGKADFMKTSHAQWKLPEGNPGGDESLYIMCDLAVASDVEKPSSCCSCSPAARSRNGWTPS